MKLVETVSSNIANSFIGYLHLGSWFDTRIKSILSGRGVLDFDSVEVFWRSLFEGGIHNGARIRFKNAFLTEWVPRTPGAAWRSLFDYPTGPFSLEGIREGKTFARKSLLGYIKPPPLGVVRLPFGTDSSAYSALCLTTKDSWCCDLGIPVLASASVYDAFVAKQRKSNAVEADIEGIVQLREMPLLDQSLFKVLGAYVDKNFLRAIFTPLGHPFVFIHLTSPLDARMRTHNSTPMANLWSISRSWATHIVMHKSVPVGSSKKPESKTIPITPIWLYGFILASAQVNQVDSIENCVKAFKLGSSVKERESCEDRGVDRIEVLTEFDGRAPRFSNSIPLRSKQWFNGKELEKISLELKQLHEGALFEVKADTRVKQKNIAGNE